jgi:exopolysaccharide biosynthesis polyprenyl glycosylphosphotransferase
MASRQAAIRLEAEESVAMGAVYEPSLAIVEPRLRSSASVVPMSIAPWAPDSIWSREAINRRLLAVGDALAVAVVLLVVLSRFGLWVGGFAAIASIPLVLVAFQVTGLYNGDDLRIGHSTLDEVPRLLQLMALLTLATAIVALSIRHSGLGGVEIAELWAASFAAVLCARSLARTVSRRLLPVERCLVMGEMAHAERIRQKLASSAARAEVVACLPMSGDDVSELADQQAMRAIAEETGAHRLIIAGTLADSDNAELIRAAKAVGVHVSVLPRMLDVVGAGACYEDLEGMTMLGVSRFELPRASRRLKRGIDLAASVIGLVVIGPLLAIIAVAIRIDSKGPILFRQTRVGRDGEHFSIFKFRSMVADADKRKEALRAVSGSTVGLFKLDNDPRITRVGNFLRKTSLDELPQLFNVLRGEMSLVGPRPLVVEEDVQIIGLHRGRLHLTPGMTGPWQLLRSRVPLHEMVEIDYLYVASWSLWQDVKILLRTAGHVVRRGNV